MKKGSFALFLAVLLGSCGTTIKVASLNDSPRALASKNPKDVMVFTIPPNKPFVEVKMLEGRQDVFSNDDIDQVIEKMRAKAAEIGCDGLVIRGKSDEYVSGQYGGKQLFGYTGACIVFTEG